MNTLVSLRLVLMTNDDGTPLMSVSDAGCGCCAGTGPVVAGQVTSDEPQLPASPQDAAELLLRLARSLAAQATALGAGHAGDPVALIQDVRDRLRAWGETAENLWLRSRDSEDHLRNQARNLLVLAEILDAAITALGGDPADAAHPYHPRPGRD